MVETSLALNSTLVDHLVNFWSGKFGLIAVIAKAIVDFQSTTDEESDL